MKSHLNCLICVTLIFLASIVNDSYCQTFIGGLIAKDSTLSASRNPYRIFQNVLINPGVTFTIEPGVSMQFDGPFQIQVNGTLVANGTELDSVRIFASSNREGEIVFGSDASSAIYDSTSDEYIGGSILKFLSTSVRIKSEEVSPYLVSSTFYRPNGATNFQEVVLNNLKNKFKIEKCLFVDHATYVYGHSKGLLASEFEVSESTFKHAGFNYSGKKVRVTNCVFDNSLGGSFNGDIVEWTGCSISNNIFPFLFGPMEKIVIADNIFKDSNVPVLVSSYNTAETNIIRNQFINFHADFRFQDERNLLKIGAKSLNMTENIFSNNEFIPSKEQALIIVDIRGDSQIDRNTFENNSAASMLEINHFITHKTTLSLSTNKFRENYSYNNTVFFLTGLEVI